MLLGDLGAEVIRVDRPGNGSIPGPAATGRSRRSVGLDLKHPEGVAILLQLIAGSDVLIEGFRPGVTERLGIGPEDCFAHNPGLVYGRMTGWGQEGPLRDRAGHDIDYIALTGALDAIGPAGGAPVPPLNLVGDFGGGALYLVMGVLAALLERNRSGRGQVVDAAMVDGASSLMTMLYEFEAAGLWEGERGTNLLDGGAPFYGTYSTSDGGWMAVGALEPQFFAELLATLEIEFEAAAQYDRERWPELRQLLAGRFAGKTRDEWTEVFRESDACVAPVLSMREAPEHPLNAARRVFIDVAGVPQAAPAPRFSRSGAEAPRPAPAPGADTDAVLGGLGIVGEELSRLREQGIIFSA
jgi:alpha-methylacyl-CoA racemase